jgi:hypothetical protein
VAQPIDETNTGTLPDPELNPLLNPLLAANMGRWAEVYFTNPPEKRAQAVADLLRELEQNPQPERAAQEDGAAAVTAEKSAHPLGKNHEDILIRDSFNATPRAQDDKPGENAAVVCQSCSHENPPTQRFCGMCGMPLPMDSSSPPPPEQQSLRQTSWHDQVSSAVANREESAARFYAEEPRYAQRPTELASLDPLQEDDAPDYEEGLFHYQSEPRRSYRLYIGIALAIIIGALVYRAWRGNATFWSSNSAPSALPQAVPSAQETEPAKSAEPAPVASAQPGSQTPQTRSAAENPSAQQKPTRAEGTPRSRRAIASSENNVESAGAQTPMAAQNGSSGTEELATAEKYLNRGTHDPQQAALWLWKSVAKQNLTAALLLSDLYVHGDGVTKSCDQARLLLDAAARKGSAAAAVRLRNLPAFGCQ